MVKTLDEKLRLISLLSLIGQQFSATYSEKNKFKNWNTIVGKQLLVPENS